MSISVQKLGSNFSFRPVLRSRPTYTFLFAAALYLALCVTAFCVVKPTTFIYFADYWEHRAIIQEVIAHGTALRDPIYGEAATSRQFTPWSLGLGYLALMTGTGVDNALAVGALLVSFLFLLGVWDFARAYFEDRWAPAIFLLTLCCCWGLPALMWTGFYNLRSQLHGNYYPASLVFALTLIAWARCIRFLRTERASIGNLIALVTIVAFAFITHPLNAVLLIAGAVGLILFEPKVVHRRRAIALAALALGVSVTVFWPYFNPLGMGQEGLARGKEIYNNFGFFFIPSFLIVQAWPAFFALLFVQKQIAVPRTRIAVAAFAATTIAYFIGWIANISVTHRLLAYILLSMHLILTRGLLDIIKGEDPRFDLHHSSVLRVFGVSLSVFLVTWQIFMAVEQLIRPWAHSHYPYPLHQVFQETSKMRDYLPANARPIGLGNSTLVLPSFGIKVAVFPRPMPFSPTGDARQADHHRFFSLGTSVQERRAIAARWGATHLVYLDHEAPLALQRDLASLGRVVAVGGPWRAISLAPPQKP